MSRVDARRRQTGLGLASVTGVCLRGATRRQSADIRHPTSNHAVKQETQALTGTGQRATPLPGFTVCRLMGCVKSAVSRRPRFDRSPPLDAPRGHPLFAVSSPLASQDEPKYSLGVQDVTHAPNRLEMAAESTDVIQGTLDMLILKSLSLQPMHGFGIAQRVEQISR